MLKWIAGTWRSRRVRLDMAPCWLTCTRSGKRLPCTRSTCRRMDFIPAPRATRRWPTYLLGLNVLGRKPRLDPAAAHVGGGAVVEARELSKTYVMGRLRV